jgi:hypothetical protein
MRSTPRRPVPVSVLSTKHRFAILSATALIGAFGAACGSQEAQDEVDKARQVDNGQQ